MEFIVSFFACILMCYRGDVVQVDTWVAASGKNGMRRDWLLRDYDTGEILTRASRLELVLFNHLHHIVMSQVVTFILILPVVSCFCYHKLCMSVLCSQASPARLHMPIFQLLVFKDLTIKVMQPKGTTVHLNYFLVNYF